MKLYPVRYRSTISELADHEHNIFDSAGLQQDDAAEFSELTIDLQNAPVGREHRYSGVNIVVLTNHFDQIEPANIYQAIVDYHDIDWRPRKLLNGGDA